MKKLYGFKTKIGVGIIVASSIASFIDMQLAFSLFSLGVAISIFGVYDRTKTCYCDTREVITEHKDILSNTQRAMDEHNAILSKMNSKIRKPMLRS